MVLKYVINIKVINNSFSSSENKKKPEKFLVQYGSLENSYAKLDEYN
jgi:hypothetical protein